MIWVIYKFVYVVAKFILDHVCCFLHCVFWCSVCLMWQCVTSSNFQTSTSWSRRYLADTPYSPISTVLSLRSAIIIFHFSLNSPWPDCCCTIIIITFELTGFLCFWSHMNSYNITSYIIYTNSYYVIHIVEDQILYTNWSNYILPSQTYEFVLYINNIIPICKYELVPLRLLSTHIYEFVLNTNNIQFVDILLVIFIQETSRYANSYISINLLYFVYTVSSNRLSITLMVSCIYSFT